MADQLKTWFTSRDRKVTWQAAQAAMAAIAQDVTDILPCIWSDWHEDVRQDSSPLVHCACVLIALNASPTFVQQLQVPMDTTQRRELGLYMYYVQQHWERYLLRTDNQGKPTADIRAVQYTSLVSFVASMQRRWLERSFTRTVTVDAAYHALCKKMTSLRNTKPQPRAPAKPLPSTRRTTPRKPLQLHVLGRKRRGMQPPPKRAPAPTLRRR